MFFVYSFLSFDGWIPVLPSTFVNKNRSVSKEGQRRYGGWLLDFCCSLKIFLLAFDLGRGLTADWRRLLYLPVFLVSHSIRSYLSPSILR